MIALVLVGASASGKSALAHSLARADHSIEIVSVDAMSVYRGMDIGTAKPTAAQRTDVPYHLIDLADPHEEFSVARFQASAKESLADIAARGKRALLVGGTGLYMAAVVDDLELPGRWPEVRAALDAEADTAAMFSRLQELDPRAAGRIEPGNRRRITRALEVSLGSGRAFSTFGPGVDAYPPRPFPMLGVRVSLDDLDRRIQARFEAMLAAGLLDEVTTLAGSLRPMSRTAAEALGYRQLLAHVRGECDLATAVNGAVTATRRYARRQLRWFRRDPRIVWIDTDDNLLAAATERLGDCPRCS